MRCDNRCAKLSVHAADSESSLGWPARCPGLFAATPRCFASPGRACSASSRTLQETYASTFIPAHSAASLSVSQSSSPTVTTMSLLTIPPTLNLGLP